MAASCRGLQLQLSQALPSSGEARALAPSQGSVSWCAEQGVKGRLNLAPWDKACQKVEKKALLRSPVGLAQRLGGPVGGAPGVHPPHSYILASSILALLLLLSRCSHVRLCATP